MSLLDTTDRKVGVKSIRGAKRETCTDRIYSGLS